MSERRASRINLLICELIVWIRESAQLFSAHSEDVVKRCKFRKQLIVTNTRKLRCVGEENEPPRDPVPFLRKKGTSKNGGKGEMCWANMQKDHSRTFWTAQENYSKMVLYWDWCRRTGENARWIAVKSQEESSKMCSGQLRKDRSRMVPYPRWTSRQNVRKTAPKEGMLVTTFVLCPWPSFTRNQLRP